MKRKEAYLLLISTSILIFAWVIFSILHSASSSTISENLNIQILPINQTFDVQTIENLKKRIQVTPENTIEGAIETSSSSAVPLSPTPPLATPTNTGTVSATL